MQPEVAERIEAIRNDRRQGASTLARQALRVLVVAAETPGGRLWPRDMEDVREAASALATAKPAMASIKNMVGRFVDRIEAMGPSVDPRTLELELLTRMEAASNEAAGLAARQIRNEHRVLTCSHSSAVVRAFRIALERGREFSVAALASRWGGLALGESLSQELLAIGVPTMVVEDDAVDEGIAGVDLVLVGADKLLPDGSVLNGWPTLALARQAAGRVPLYVVGESFKADTEPDSEEGYERVPANLIAGVLTDRQTRFEARCKK